MNMRPVILSFVALMCFSCAHAPRSKAPPVMRVPAGTNIPSIGMGFDVSYDSETDNIVPGYKILSAAIVNNSMDIIQMDKTSDQWLLLDARGNKHEGILDLRTSDPEIYLSLPDKLRRKMEYPILIQVGESRVIDILFKDSVRLDGYRSIKLTSKVMNKAFEIIPQD